MLFLIDKSAKNIFCLTVYFILISRFTSFFLKNDLLKVENKLQIANRNPETYFRYLPYLPTNIFLISSHLILCYLHPEGKVELVQLGPKNPRKGWKCAIRMREKKLGS